MTRLAYFSILSLIILMVFSIGCQSQNSRRRDQELTKLKQELRGMKGTRTDTEVVVDELKLDISRLANVVEERAQYQNLQFESLQKGIESLDARIKALEQYVVTSNASSNRNSTPPPESSAMANASFGAGKKLYDQKSFSEAITVFKSVAATSDGKDQRLSLFFIADSHYFLKEYTQAAIEFGNYKKRYPKASNIPLAIYRQAQCFKNLRKKREAQLFYQELIERFPRHNLAKAARNEMK